MIPNIVSVTGADNIAPILLVEAFPKIGKCLSGDTLLISPRGERILLRDLVREKSARPFLVSGAGGLLVEASATQFVENKPEQVFELRTQSGRAIKATKSHPFLTQRGWVPLGELSPDDDRVFVVTEYPVEMFKPPMHVGALHNARMTVLAYLIADGSLGGACPIFTKNEPAVRDDFLEALEVLGDSYSQYEQDGVIHTRVISREKRVSNTMALLREQELAGKLSGDKFVPPFVFGSSSTGLQLFLSRLFTCDGCIEAKGWVSYSSKSARLVQQVQHLLARFGVVSLIRPKYLAGDLYGAELKISSRANVIRFADRIGMIGEKGARLAAHRERLAALSSTDGVETQLWRHGPYILDRIDTIEASGVEPTFDIEVPGHANFIANDFVAHNSTLGATLAGWQGKEPLFIAWDRSGPDSCLKLGYQPKALRIADLQGTKLDGEKRVVESHYTKGKAALATLEANRAELHATYNSLIIDCASTMSDRFFEEARRFSVNPDPRSHYGDTLRWSDEFMNRIVDLGMPTVWLAWMKPSELVQEKSPRGQTVSKMVPGGPLINGAFRERIAGKAHQILILDREKHTPQTPGADDEGWVRMLRSRTWNNITAGGRYAHVLPETLPAHLGVVMAAITGRGREQYPWFFR